LVIGGGVNARKALLWCRRTDVFRHTIDDAYRELGDLRRSKRLARIHDCDGAVADGPAVNSGQKSHS